MKDKAKVLIVDDVPQNIQFAIEILKEDYIVSVAKSALKALEILENNLNPDLILLDIIMPDIDGYELCSRLKSDKRYQDIPVIFLTILENDQDMIKGLQLGAVDYISKPFEPEVLKARVKTHINLKLHQDTLLDTIRQKDEILIKQSKMVMLGKIFENIVYQWKHPLSILTMSTANIKLKQALGNLDEEKLEQLLEDVETTSRYFSQTIDEFKDFLSIDKPKGYFSILNALKQVLKILESKIISLSAVVHTQIDEYELFTHKSDLIQVIMIILLNALEILSKEDKSKEISIMSKQDENHYICLICCQIGNTDKLKLDRVFDEDFSFFDSKDESAVSMFICKKIVENSLNGTIEITTESSEICFNISLPSAKNI